MVDEAMISAQITTQGTTPQATTFWISTRIALAQDQYSTCSLVVRWEFEVTSWDTDGATSGGLSAERSRRLEKSLVTATGRAIVGDGGDGDGVLSQRQRLEETKALMGVESVKRRHQFFVLRRPLFSLSL